MMKETNHTGGKGAVVAEIAVGVVLIALWCVFFYYRTCIWDTVVLAIWAVVLVLSGALLFRAERRLRTREERQG